MNNEIIHFILGNNNLIIRDDCIKKIDNFINYYSEKEIDNLLIEKCDRIFFSNQLNKFCLKKTFFQFCDINYFIDYKLKTNAMKYLLEFQSNNYNFMNTFFASCLSIQENLNKYNYDIFFNETNNITLFTNIFQILILNENYFQINHIFLFNFSKILSVYINLYKDSINIDLKYNIIEALKNNKIKENNYQSYLHYLKNILINNENKNEKENDKNEIIIRKNTLINKYKNQFKEKNQNFTNKFLSNTKNENEYNIININENNNNKEEEEICIFCRQSLNKNNLDNYFGKLCFKLSDFFIDILNNIEKNNLRKKKSRFVTCNHKIHFNCYEKFIIENYQHNDDILKDGFSCPLCKKLSNIFLCDLKSIYLNKNDILKGCSFQNKNFDEIYNYNNENLKILIPIINFFEEYSSSLLKHKVLINDINENKILFENLYNIIIEDFKSFFTYYLITDYKNEQIEIWKNIILIIRYLLKTFQLKYLSFFINKINKFLLDLDNNNFYIIYEIIEFFFCLTIIFDFENKSIFSFYNDLITYFFFYYYLKINKNKNINEVNFIEFLNNNNNLDLLRNLYNKFHINYKIFLLLNNIDETIISFEETISIIKDNKNIPNIIKNYLNLNQSNDNNLVLIYDIFNMPKFKIIDLPNNFLELSSIYADKVCIECHKLNSKYYICLICGEKICNLKTCQREINFKNKKEYSLIIHSKNCSGGNSLFLKNTNSEIIYILKRTIIFSKKFIYLNSFGEYLNKSNLTSEYILNKAALEKSLQNYINLSFRIKLNKIQSIPQQ